MILIDGKKTAADIRGEIAAEIASCVERGVRTPGLAVILVGEDPASQVYVRNKERACAQVGMLSETIRMSKETMQHAINEIEKDLHKQQHVFHMTLRYSTVTACPNHPHAKKLSSTSTG